ncbi:MAG TPA: hypothetical protein VJV05_03850 [Pyrinomonadaceae bacterium]|nr:hypothetical protein [Pyrinomonadaceae bacterium]
MNEQDSTRTKTRPSWAITLVAIVCVLLCGQVVAQQSIRQLPAPVPKLILNSGATEIQGRRQQRIALTITNWEKYPAEMFAPSAELKLPPNPCSGATSRIVISIYSHRGDPLVGCILASRPESLRSFTFAIQRGKPMPDFVYVVIHDRYTGAAYRSNLVSPATGATR